MGEAPPRRASGVVTAGHLPRAAGPLNIHEARAGAAPGSLAARLPHGAGDERRAGLRRARGTGAAAERCTLSPPSPPPPGARCLAPLGPPSPLRAGRPSGAPGRRAAAAAAPAAMEPAQQQQQQRAREAAERSPGGKGPATENGAEAAGGPRRRRGAAGGSAPPAAPAAPGGAGGGSLLLRRGRLKRNLSAAAAPLGTRSLDRKALLPKPPRQLQPLQPPERDWVRRDLQRGCVHVYERHANRYLRPVLCTLETTAAEVAARLQQPGPRGGGSGGVVRVPGKAGPQPPPPEEGLATATAEPTAEGERPGNRRGTRGAPPAGGTEEGGSLSPAAPPAELYLAGPPLSCPSLLGELGPAGSDCESFSPGAESVSERLDPYSSGGGGSSSSDELEAEPAPSDGAEAGAGPGRGRPPPGEPCPGAGGGREAPAGPPALFVQLHGETSRRLEGHEKPLRIQNDYLSQLGFRDLWRVQEEGMDAETGCLIRFYAGESGRAGPRGSALCSDVVS